MDKNVIKSFAIESRRKLISDIEYQMNLLGITADEILKPSQKAEGMESYNINGVEHTIYDEEIKQRNSLVKEVQNKGYENVIEEVAYTWFNRIIAIRFMEINDYLPTRTRVLSSNTEGKTEPDIITEAFDLDLNYTDEDKQRIFKLKEENKSDDLFQFLFIKQCNKLNEILPGLFEKTSDYSELLLNISFTDADGIIKHLINISEENFINQVEIIGWMYQYYNAELKDETFEKAKKEKVSKEKIPAITQLFTPKWIVKYMVENSLGRMWIEGHDDSDLKEKWKYYVDNNDQLENTAINLNKILESYSILKIEDITIIDPCMGSGHLLVYAIDILMDIYLSLGYSKKDATIKILENNIHGLDIDDRAYQLSYFAILMKCRQYNRKILNLNIDPMICSIQESNSISDTLINFIINQCPSIESDLKYLIEIFKDAKEYGSLINIKNINFNLIKETLEKINLSKNQNLDLFKFQNEIKLVEILVNQAEILSNKYSIVMTNPPYMGQKNRDNKLKNYIDKNYPHSKADLCTVFIERCNQMVSLNGLCSMITQQSFMFLKTFEKLRYEFLRNTLINMIHLGPHAFDEINGEVVQTTSFIYLNQEIENYKTKYYNLVDFNSEKNKEIAFLNNNENIIYSAFKEDFLNIPGSPIAYWADKPVFEAFQNGTSLIEIANVKQGLATADNNRFLKQWFEVELYKIGFNISSCVESKNSNLKWFPYNKGGSFKKWYGNQNYVINWENDGYELKNFKKSVLRNSNFYFQKSLSWSKISSGSVSFRYFPTGFLFDVAGCSVFVNDKKYYIMGFLNSDISRIILEMISPTLNYEVGHISAIPLIFNCNNKIEILVRENINICKNDWDDYETSWNFKTHPLVRFNDFIIEDSFNKWNIHKNSDFNKLQQNEVELNKIFSEIYSIDVDPSVEDKYVSVTKADYKKDIKSLISFAVACMFGRYSLDDEGIVFAGGKFDLDQYSKFIPDDDNIIPVLDTEYFKDDIVGRFEEFIKICFGSENLEENLDFIAKALDKKGNSNREIIRNYFLNDFFKDHVKTYQKCPIFWQFDSGKQNGFKCLIYMHRYEPDLVARVRTNYLHKTQKAIEQAIQSCDNILNSSSNNSDKKKATNDKNRLVKQLEETRIYDEALAHIANQKIDIDLDDGVKVNYAKFQNIELHTEGQKNKKLNLLKKI